jgi:AcrR family transcriptional regulator
MSPAATIDDAAARAAVLRSADAIFTSRGVADVGMAEIRDAAGVSLRRLYTLYPSKRNLVAAWLAARHVTWMDWFAGAVERHAAAGVEPLLAGFDAIAEWAETPGYRGCAFVNTAAESGEIDDTHRAIVADHKHGLVTYCETLAEAGGYREPARLGRMIAVLLDGAMAQAAVLSSVEPVHSARAAAAIVLEASR